MNTLETHEVVEAIPALTEKDKCDRCVQQARWAVKLHEDSEVLMFCFHHSYIFETYIVDAYAIRDERLQFLMFEDAIK